MTKKTEDTKIPCFDCYGDGHRPFYYCGMFNGIIQCQRCGGTGEDPELTKIFEEILKEESAT